MNSKLDISVERVIRELARVAFFDPLEFWNEDGTVKPLHEMSEDARRAIVGLDVAEMFEGSGEQRRLAGYVKKFKLANKGCLGALRPSPDDVSHQARRCGIHLNAGFAHTRPVDPSGRWGADVNDLGCRGGGLRPPMIMTFGS